jgi:hypothetical protein
MTLNVPYKVRAALYIFTSLGTPVIAYLFAKDIIGELEVTLWAAEVTAVNIMAALKTAPVEGEKA